MSLHPSLTCLAFLCFCSCFFNLPSWAIKTLKFQKWENIVIEITFLLHSFRALLSLPTLRSSVTLRSYGANPATSLMISLTTFTRLLCLCKIPTVISVRTPLLSGVKKTIGTELHWNVWISSEDWKQSDEHLCLGIEADGVTLFILNWSNLTNSDLWEISVWA